MSLKAKIDAAAFEALDDSLKALYTEKEGDYVLEIEGFVAADEVENTDGLKSALKKEREAARAAAQKAKALESKLAGIDPEKYQTLLDAEQSAEQQKLEQAGEWDKIKAQMVEAHAAEISTKDSEIQRLQGQLEHVEIDSKVVEAISKAGGNVELLKPHVRSRLQLNTDDFSTTVLDGDGKTPKVDGDGNPVTIDTLISEMRKSDTYAGAFKASEQSGSGSDPQSGGDGPTGINGGTPTVESKPRSQMTDREKVDFQLKHGIDALMDLPA